MGTGRRSITGIVAGQRMGRGRRSWTGCGLDATWPKVLTGSSVWMPPPRFARLRRGHEGRARPAAPPWATAHQARAVGGSRRIRRIRPAGFGLPCAAGGTKTTIPEPANQIAGRLVRGNKGGRPPAFDREAYKRRNAVERAFNKLRGTRAVATRYDESSSTREQSASRPSESGSETQPSTIHGTARQPPRC